ncbi:MAG TPA: UbiD family decarboxylase domain-containing protein, partial [Candidatus Binatia bacterium]|nr:UbiD family decarboxylase domain-containing protein [Candidatus Binatia bacterium]
MPAAAVIGASPSVYYAAIEVMPFGVDEIDIAGALEGAPVEIVRCKTIDLEVPAHAEIILEGRVRTDILEPEGAFGEAHGYCDPRFLGMIFEITAITHRQSPIYLSIISQLTPSESSKSKQKGYEAECLRYLRDERGFGEVVHVTLYENLLNRQYGVVELKKTGAQKVMDILEAFTAKRQGPKIVVAVDDDIDSASAQAVNWAIVNRSQPHRDVRIVHPRPLPFGPLQFAADGVGYDREDSALLIDATKKTNLPPVALPARPYMEQALKIWGELGLPAVEADGPWYGYSLGEWSEAHAAEAALAVEGRYYETGDKLATEAVKTEPGTKLGSLHRHLRNNKGVAMTIENASQTDAAEKPTARQRIERFRKLAREQNQNSMMSHPVTAAICEGRASRDLLKALVLNLYSFALESNAAAVGIKQWNRRQMLLGAPEINFVVVTEKVIDELTNPGPSGHMRMLEILWKTLGGAREELLLSSPSTEVRVYSDHHVRATLDEGRSSFDEEQFGHWSALIYNALVDHYGFTPEQAIYFKEHGEADTM